jgi:hypothetical protein
MGILQPRRRGCAGGSAEWNVTIEEAIEMEARAQAHCMDTNDFKRAYEAFANKQKPVFQGN